MKAARIEIIL